MKRCAKCHYEVKDDSTVFCPHCGGALGAVAPAPRGESGISIGDKAIVTGAEIIAKKEEHHHHETINHISQVDDRTRMKTCSVCGVQKEAGFFACPECHKDVCGDHYDPPRLRCLSCADRAAHLSQQHYSEAVRDSLEHDNAINLEKRKVLDLLAQQLELAPHTAKLIEKQITDQLVRGSWSEDDGATLRRALQAHREGQVDYALDQLTLLRGMHRDQPELWEAWLEVMLGQGYEKALQAAQECPINTPLQFQVLVEAFGALGQVAEARDCLRRSMAISSPDFVASRPRFLALKALLDLKMFQQKQSAAWLEDAERTLAAAGAGDAFVTVVRAFAAHCHGDDALLRETRDGLRDQPVAREFFDRVTRGIPLPQAPQAPQAAPAALPAAPAVPAPPPAPPVPPPAPSRAAAPPVPPSAATVPVPAPVVPPGAAGAVPPPPGPPRVPARSRAPRVAAGIVVLCAALGGGGWWFHQDRLRAEAALKLVQDEADQKLAAATQARQTEEQKRLEAEQAAHTEAAARATAEAEAQSQAEAARKAKEEAGLARQQQEQDLAQKQAELGLARQGLKIPVKCLKLGDHRYPVQAVQNGADPARDYIVTVKLVVDPAGHPTQVVVTDGPPASYGFNDVAVAAVRGGIYAPATLGGNPVPSTILQDIHFKLR